MQLILQTEPTANIKTKMSALGETVARSQISDAISNMEDDICALNKTCPTIVQDSKQSSKNSEITLNNEQLEDIINDIDSISKTNGDVVNEKQKLEPEIEKLEIDNTIIKDVSAAHDQSNGKLTSTESFQRTSNLADNGNLTELLENSKESIEKDSADTVCVKHEEKPDIEINFENKSEVTSVDKEVADNINIESSPAFVTKFHNEKHSDANPSQDISSGNGNIEGSVGDQYIVSKEAAFSANSETYENNFNISAQLKHLEEDSLMDGNPSKTFLSDNDMNSQKCEETKECEKAIPTIPIKNNDANASKDNELENVVDRGQKLNEQKNEMNESEISNEKSLVDHKDQLQLPEKEVETIIDKNLEVSVDLLPEEISEGKMNVQVLEQEIKNDITEDESQKEKDLVSLVHIEQQSVESVTVLGCTEVDNNSILTQDSPMDVDNAGNVDKISLVQTDIISEDNIDKSKEGTSNIFKNVEASHLEKLSTEDKTVQQIEETMDIDEISAAISSSEISDNVISENIVSETQSVEKASVLGNNINISEAIAEKDTSKDGDDTEVPNDKEQILNDQNCEEIAMGSDDIEVIINTNNSDIAVEKDLIQNVEEINEIIKDQDADIKIINKGDETQNCDLVNSDSKNDDVHKVISIYDSVKEPIVENQTKPVSELEIIDEEEVTNVEETHNIEVEEDKITEKQLPVVCKLSNTMDILSEDEDDPPIENTISEPRTNTQEENKFINIDDDDDIMFIEDTEDSNVKSCESGCETQTESEINDENKNTNNTEHCAISPIEEISSNISDDKDEVKTSEIDHQELVDTNTIEANDKECNSPIITNTFLKSVIKNLAEMTRNELEDFCVLKLVEALVDKGNLKEIKEKMMTMSRTIEELRKKALVLMKQNRDLQVVIKTVQENQKNINPAAIIPMKITRSVGMQVVLSSAESNANLVMKKKPIKPVQNMLSPKAQKPIATNIPVPRLVPASSPNNKNISPVNNVAKPVALVRTPPARPEKRPHNRLSPASSLTVDLTDDEPPTKVLVAQRNPAPPVRVVPSQNLMPMKQRTQFGATGNSQRKVYIPISGAQANGLRPGSNFMRNFVHSPISRARSRLPHRLNHGSRHPAPLPDAMKQYQPPMWKALPPAPDLKLSKVDNGIVISWKFEGYQTETYEQVASFQLYAYQETNAPPSTALWKKIGDIKALPLPMACTLTQFISGFKYYFAVRAVDIRSRLGPFSLPGSIMLLSKS